MKKVNVVITDWKNGEVVNHIQQLTQKEFKKYNNGGYHVYELDGYKKSMGKVERDIPKFYWVMRPSIGTPQTYPYANDVIRTAAITFISYEEIN